MGYLYIFFTILFTVYGQLVIKWQITKAGRLPDHLLDKVVFLISQFLNPWILSGFGAAFMASLFWMAAMTRFELSFAYPIVIAGLLVLTSLAAMTFLNEPISFVKVAGPLLILSGVCIMFFKG